MREGKGDWWWRGEDELRAKQIERLQAEIERLRAERDAANGELAERFREIERLTAIANTDTPELEMQHAEILHLRAQLADTAAFLDRMATQMDDLDVIIDAADCRAMAKKLRARHERSS